MPIALASAVAVAVAVAAVVGALAGCCLPLLIYRLGTDQPRADRRIAAHAAGCDHPVPAGDLRCHRLPDRVVLPAAALGALTIITVGFTDGDQHRTVRALVSCFAVGVVLLLLAVGTQAIGLGDVKATAWVAMLAGWHSPTAVLIAAVGPFLLQAPIALGLLAAKRVNRRSTLPFGPAILLAGLASLTLTSIG